MSVRSKCPGCGASLKISLAHAGKKGKCPGCGKTLKMPSEEQLRQMMARQSSKSGMAVGSTSAVAAAPAKPSPPPQSPAQPPADDLFDDLGSSNFDEDDFDFPDPPAAGTQETVNPYASPLAEYKAELSASNKLVYAGFMSRWGAAIVDGLVLLAISWAIGFSMAFAAAIAGMTQTESGLAVVQLAIQVVAQVAGLLYFALMESSASQATYGKRMAGIKVTDVNGHPISFGRAVARYLAKIVSTLTLMIGYLMAAFTPKKQALHDMMVGTLVVKA
ncbi:RDD family protein [Posidoniimonas polymericola]|nr:RDD family protein [Posidoniimonas polymericola]